MTPFVGTTGSNQDQLDARLVKGDCHGCLLMVSRFKYPSHIGVKGIVLLETKNTFQIICPDNKLKSNLCISGEIGF
jgi:RNase P/RNase MRP subunit p29